MSRFTFKPVEKAERALIHEWLRVDHVSQWIHGEGLKNTLVSLDKFLEGDTYVRHWIAYDGDTPFGYLMTSTIAKDSPEDADLATYCKEPGDAITLDLFICNTDYLGKGLGVPMIQEFLLSAFPTVSEVLIDPEVANTRATHVYEKAGFRIIEEFIAPWHPVPHYRMLLSMKELKLRLQ